MSSGGTVYFQDKVTTTRSAGSCGVSGVYEITFV